MKYEAPTLTLVGEAKGVVLGGTFIPVQDSHKQDIEADVLVYDLENRF